MNFRGITHLTLKLDETTVLIGENNTGKSTVLEALQICLSRSLTRKGDIFSEYDYHLGDKDSQPVESDAIGLTLRFTEQSDGEWPDEVSQVLPEVVQVGADGLQRVILRVNSSFDDVASDFVTTWDFLDLAGNTLVAAKAPRNIISLQQFAPVFYLAALRNSAQEFRPRSQFWGPFVRSLKIDPTLRQELEDELAQLNEKVLSANDSFAMVKERLGKTGEMVPLDSDAPVGIEAIPGKVFDILSRTQVMLTSITGARLPIGRHGEGTQSLAVICLFDAFLQGRLADSYTEFTSPILAIEEPEAHLHPSAIRAAGALLKGLPGQKIMATHSGDLVSGFSLSSLRRFRRRNGMVSVHQIEQHGGLSADDIRKLDYHVRSTRGNLLFARCWLLVEGETDWFVLSESAAICGYDLVSEGISLVTFAQVGVETFIRAADQLGIDWMVVADGDQEGSGYLTHAKEHVGDRETSRRIHQLMHGNMEVFLCMEGYGYVYEQNVAEQKKHLVTAENGTLEYWHQVSDAQRGGAKPVNAAAVVEEMRIKGEGGVPAQLRSIVECATDLAKGLGDD